MKTIKLNKGQKDKLLKICVELFPKYSRIEFNDPSDPDAGIDSLNGVLHFGQRVGDTGFNVKESIHWLELCITHIMPELRIYHYSYETWRFSDTKIHYVDYLYNEFLKYKAEHEATSPTN